MSSNPLMLFTRSGKVLLVVLLASWVASCQVKPLYSTGSAVSKSLAAVEISDARTSIEQNVRNNLIFLLSGGAGQPAKPEYKLEMNVTSALAGVLLVESSDRAQAGQMTVSATYTLRRISDGQIIKATSRSATSLVDFSVQEFAKKRAVLDAENRASRELAELVRADVAGALGR